jgi:excisionase family DNA binding protein
MTYQVGKHEHKMRIAHRRNTAPHPLSTIRELATWLQIHPAALYRAAQAGEIPAMKAGGRWRFSRDAVERWILDRMNDQTALIKEPGPWLLLDFSPPRRARPR